MPRTAMSMNIAELVNAISRDPTVPIVNHLSMLNWWIGSTVMAGSAFLGRSIRRLRPQIANSILRSPAAETGPDAGPADHVEHARREAEQHEHDQAPGRDPERAVEEPADHRSHEHAAHKLGREPEAARHRRGIDRPGRRIRSGRAARARVELCAETLEPRGESGIVGRPGPFVLVFARAVAHALDARKAKKIRAFSRATPRSRADHTDRVGECQESATCA